MTNFLSILIRSCCTIVIITSAIALIPNAVVPVAALNICIAGGTGNFGRLLASKLVENGDAVTILSRNKYLASSPSRVTETFGWLGESYLNRYPHVTIRDWDGGDLLDIVGKDWVGWQEDTLSKADVVINLVGGFTNQRLMAVERIVRESTVHNPTALQITVSPKDVEDISILDNGPAAATVKWNRLEQCENIVKQNCIRYKCFRFEANCLKKSCDEIMATISMDNK